MKELKQVRTGMAWSGAAAVVLYIITRLTDSDFFFGLTVIAMGAFLFFAVFNLCPHCSQPLWGRGSAFAEYCPHCGKKLSLTPDEGGVDDEQK